MLGRGIICLQNNSKERNGRNQGSTTSRYRQHRGPFVRPPSVAWYPAARKELSEASRSKPAEMKPKPNPSPSRSRIPYAACQVVQYTIQRHPFLPLCQDHPCSRLEFFPPLFFFFLLRRALSCSFSILMIQSLGSSYRSMTATTGARR